MSNEHENTVISGTAKVNKEKKIIRFFKGLFVGDPGSAKDNVIEDVAKPGIRNLCYKVVTSWFDYLFNGKITKNNNTGFGSGFFNYAGIYQQNTTRTPNTTPSSINITSNIVYMDYEDAMAIIAAFNNKMSDVGVVSVANIVEWSGKTPAHTDWDWGYKKINITPSDIREVMSDGEVAYKINFPSPMCIIK